MRIYNRFGEAFSEIRRDLKEMGIRVSTTTVQDMSVVGNKDYDALELQNYFYTVTTPQFHEVPTKEEDREWLEAEFDERISYESTNPGDAWIERKEYWAKFLHGRPPKFAYTYNESLHVALPAILEALQKDLSTRQAFIPIYQFDRDIHRLLTNRIPCSIGYWLNYRQSELSMTYLQRSADFSEHFANDVYLAVRLLVYISRRLEVPVGYFSHWLGSLHVFNKDVKGVF